MVTATISVPAKHAAWMRERLDGRLETAGELLLSAREPEVESDDPPATREAKRQYQAEYAIHLATEALIAKERLGELWPSQRPEETVTFDIDLVILQESLKTAWEFTGEDLQEADAAETGLILDRIAWLKGLAEEGTIPWPAETHAAERGLMV